MEAHWTGRAQFPASAPKPTYRAQHKFLVGPLPDQGETTCQHVLESKVLPTELLTEPVPRFPRGRRERCHHSQCVECPREPQ